MQIKIILHHSEQSRLRKQVTTHAVEDMRKGIIYLFLLVGVQISIATMSISVAILKEPGYRYTSRSSYNTSGHRHKGLYAML